jgi:hypothetical protein
MLENYGKIFENGTQRRATAKEKARLLGSKGKAMT